MKITDLKCAVLGQNPMVRITTDEGISGYGEVEASKSYLKPHILFYRDFVLGEDPTNVERVMLKIRRWGGFKPWGSAVSAIEMALWDIAGKAAGVPVHKLLGDKIRDKVRVYKTGLSAPLEGIFSRGPWQKRSTDQDESRGLHHYQARRCISQPYAGSGPRFFIR